MLFKKNELKYLWPFYLQVMIYGLSTMIFPFTVVHFMNLGFSYLQIAIITAANGFAMFLFEIPTGAFADGFSRKKSMIIGCSITAISTMLIAFTSNFYLITVLWAIAGVGMTFSSGSDEALVIGNLRKMKRLDLQQEYYIKQSSFLSLGSIFAPIIGAVLVKNYNINILWFIFGIGFLLNAFIIGLFAKENYTSLKLSPSELAKKTVHTTKLGVAYSLKHKVVFYFIIAGLFIDFMMVSNIGMQPFLVDLGMQQYQLGYLFSVTAAVGIGMSFLSRYVSRFHPGSVMSVVVLVVMLLLLSLLFIYPPHFIIACIVFSIKGGMFNVGMPVLYTFVHQFIPERIRATIMSVKSMADQLVIAIITIVSGTLMDFFGPQKILAFGGLFGILAIFFFQKLKIKKYESTR